jgi:hypothetical protein
MQSMSMNLRVKKWSTQILSNANVLNFSILFKFKRAACHHRVTSSKYLCAGDTPHTRTAQPSLSHFHIMYKNSAIHKIS